MPVHIVDGPDGAPLYVPPKYHQWGEEEKRGLVLAVNEAIALYPHSEPQQIAHVMNLAATCGEPWADQFNHTNAQELVRSVTNAQEYMRDWNPTPPPGPTPPPDDTSQGGVPGGFIPTQGGRFPWDNRTGGASSGTTSPVGTTTGNTTVPAGPPGTPDLRHIAAVCAQLAVQDHAQAEQYGEQRAASDRRYRASVKSAHVSSATGRLMERLAPVADDHPEARSYRELMRLGGVTFGEFNLSSTTVDECLRRASDAARTASA